MSAAAVDTVNATPLSGSKEMSLEEPKKMTREDWRKKKELEEQRKLGNAPAEVDEEGKDINPHIPQYISSVPWYIDPSKRPTLKHQRPQPEKQKQFSSSGEWYKRGVKENSITTKYRKGACENCGAMTHKKKDCFERPRRVGAKFTGTNIAPDEHIQPQLMFDYDGKRDRWNGYNPEEHMKIVEEYAKVDLEKDHNSEDEDEDKYADDIDMPGQNFDSKRRITVRNLRIREDIAKADPTKLELLYKSFKVKKEDFKEQQKESILEKYGGQEHLDAPPAELLLAQTEDYVEYSRHGTVIKGQERAVACSKYEEDVKIHNHTNSEECIINDATGEESVKKPQTLMELHQEKLKEEKKKKKKKKKHRKSSSDSDDEDRKHEKLKKALNAEEARLLHVKEIMQTDERKRPYNSIYESREPTEEEMEAYRMKRQRPDDPMASFLGQE
ncbi:hypothetical protein A6R68_18865 [Neotoma lepida]|uniref:Pre-mRNA-splicing factor SLU7 n=1 Tax=Neotoma lepida TaxID=56216 RepID=A0A1A6HKI9_NEOLE|nr:hypothetical protein A6R68_18865 [Neotoma lepida]